MYTERFSLSFIAQVLMAAAERRRPGLGAWSPSVRDDLKKVFETELTEVRKRFFEVFDDTGYWAKVEKTLLEDCFVRYCAAAEKQTRLELADYEIWRGGDLLARGALALGGLAVGVFMVEAPFIRFIPEQWGFFAAFTMLGAPFIPDGQVWWAKRRYRKTLETIVEDMRAAEVAQELYLPLQDGSRQQEVSRQGVTPVVDVTSSGTDMGDAVKRGDRTK